MEEGVVAGALLQRTLPPSASRADRAMTCLRLILGDQLNVRQSWFQRVDDSVLYVMMEVRSETDYVLHHAQKVLGIFAAMRH